MKLRPLGSLDEWLQNREEQQMGPYIQPAIDGRNLQEKVECLDPIVTPPHAGGGAPRFCNERLFANQWPEFQADGYTAQV